jgi:hypothetical protein
MKVVFCRACGRIALRSFLYCPYCGVPLKSGPGMEEACASFDRLEEMQSETRARRIEELLAALEGIETDMEALLHGSMSSAG